MSYTGHLDDYSDQLEGELDEMAFDLYQAQSELFTRDRKIKELEERIAMQDEIIKGICKTVGVKSL